jgi:hypothetical protein
VPKATLRRRVRPFIAGQKDFLAGFGEIRGQGSNFTEGWDYWDEPLEHALSRG